MALPKTMKVAVVTQYHTLEIQDIPLPPIGSYQALVKIEACGLCGTTDQHLLEGRQCHHPADQYPAILGHEAVGTVVEIGPNVTSFKPGDRVTRPAAIAPGDQRDGLYSAWGGFAQYGVVNDRKALVAAGQTEYQNNYNALRQDIVPADLDPVHAALAISLAEIASWVDQLPDLSDKTLLVGGAGLAGLAICYFAKQAKAKTVIVLARRDQPLAHARRCGADHTINIKTQDPRAALNAISGPVDIFAEATGTDAVCNLGLTLLKPNATLAIYGAPTDYTYSIDLHNVPGPFTFNLIPAQEHLAYHRVCQLILNHQLDPSLFLTQTYQGLQSIPQALEDQTNKKLIKAVIKI